MKRAALLALAVASLAAAGCGLGAGRGNSGSGSTTAIGPAVTPSLTTSVSTATATWGILVMGGSAASEDNFWQLFTRPTGAGAWQLVTPPGVADNGGLVMASAGGGPLVVGIRPSQGLTFSPLATTSDDGTTWTPGLVDAGLADAADSLAVVSGSGQQFALLGNGAIEGALSGAASPSGSGWSKLAAPGSIAASAPGKSCGLSSVDAITVTPSAELLAGGACDNPGTAGIFGYSGGTWHAAAPVLPGTVARDRVQVLRLTATPPGNVALVLAGTDLFAAWTSNGGTRWTVSPPLATGAAHLSSAAFGSGGAVGVLLSSGKTAAASGPGSPWQALPAAPPDTAVLAFTPSAARSAKAGQVEALAAAGAKLTVWQLSAPAGSWTSIQTITVPIQYGSSS
jgi:hypothetical protein